MKKTVAAAVALACAFFYAAFDMASAEASTVVHLERTRRSSQQIFRHPDKAGSEGEKLEQRQREEAAATQRAVEARLKNSYRNFQSATDEKIDDAIDDAENEIVNIENEIENIEHNSDDKKVDAAGKKIKKPKAAANKKTEDKKAADEEKDSDLKIAADDVITISGEKIPAAAIVEKAVEEPAPAVKKEEVTAAAKKPLVSKQAPAKEKSPLTKPLKFRKIPVQSIDVGGTLLFSDSPEYVKEPGILYADQVKGDARVLYYHVNETGRPVHVAAVIENKNDRYAVVHLTRYGQAKPSPWYFAVGKAAQLDYCGSQESSTLYLAPGGRRLLHTDMGKTILAPGDLVYGIYDFSTSVPVNVTVLCYGDAVDPLKYLDRAKALPADKEHLRGTFHGMDRIITAAKPYRPGRDGPGYITLGDDDNDKFLTGIDALDGSLVKNHGNYGVVYRLNIPVSGTAKCYLTPLGGAYAGAAIVETAAKRKPQDVKKNTLGIPSGEDYFGMKGPNDDSVPDEKGNVIITPSDETAFLGTFSEQNETIIEMSPPGASNLPVRLFFLPGKQERN